MISSFFGNYIYTSSQVRLRADALCSGNVTMPELQSDAHALLTGAALHCCGRPEA